jgi:UDP-glucose 4-epimerase
MLKTFETNALGSYNIINACLAHGVESALLIGTDKQCSPINVYGMSKHLAASMFSDANRFGKTKFISVRYGNVLCSRSSLGVIAMEQAAAGKPLTVTDPSMTRFFFTIQEGVRLIDMALNRIYNGFSYRAWLDTYYGATISTQMCAVTLGDFFEVLSTRFNVPVNIIGRRPGEKTHEHLMADYELRDTFIDKENSYSPFYSPSITLNQYITIPHLNEIRDGFSEIIECVERPTKVFSSADAPRLTKDEIWTILDYAYKNTFKD